MAYDFDAGTTRLSPSAITPTTSTGNNVELAAWVHADGSGEGGSGAVLAVEAAGAARFLLRFTATNRLFMFADCATTDSQATADATEALTNGLWYCVFGSYNDTTKLSRIFVGTETSPVREVVIASVAGVGALQTGGTQAAVGNRQGQANTWDGRIMHAVIAADEWSMAERERFRRTCIPAIRPSFGTPTLRGWWPLVGDLNDLSGYGGTLVAAGGGGFFNSAPTPPGAILPRRKLAGRFR